MTTQDTTQTVTLAGSGLTFVNTYSGISSGYISSIIAAENFFQSHFSNNVTLYETFTVANLGTGVANNLPVYYGNISYSALKGLLSADASTANNIAAINSLPTIDPTNGAGFLITTGEAKALGLSVGGGSDGTVNLNTSLAYFFNGTPVAGEYDATAALEHELSEEMGRIGGLGSNVDGFWGPIDLFRFSAPGQRDYSGGADGQAAYFSVNGSTLLTQFNNPATTDPQKPSAGGDVADWNVGGAYQVAIQVSDGYDAFGASPTDEAGVVSSADLTVMNILGWTPTGAANVTPTVVVNVQSVSIAENNSIAASSLITSVSNPNGDNITEYGFWDGGTGNGHFTVNGTVQPDGQWIYVLANNLSSIQYVGGATPGNESLYVNAFDATTGVWSNYSSLTATTTAPPTQTIVVNVQNVSVAENASIAASSLITSVSNPSGDSITGYAFWDGGTGNGHFAVNGATQPDGQWIVVNASNLSGVQYVGGASPGSESLFVEVFDGTTGTWSNYSSLTATTTVPHIAPTVNVQNVSISENASIAASSLITSVSNPSGDSITGYGFWDGGTGNGHFTINGTTQPDGQWIVVNASNLSGVQYVGGASPGDEALFVDVYDGTTGTWSNYGTLTATTTAPHSPATVNVQNVSVGENASIAASSLITSVSNPSGDNITGYAFWDGGTGNGHFTVNGSIQPDMQWNVVSASNLSSIQYIGGASPGNEPLYVTVYDATIGTWSNTNSLTATTTALTNSLNDAITELYVGYYNRAPDPSGETYWVGRLESGMSLSAIAQSYSVQTESTNLYPFLASPNTASTTAVQAFVTSVYENLFNRAPDPAGESYWVTQLQTGASTVGGAIINIISGAQLNDLATINNKVVVGDYFDTQIFLTVSNFRPP